MPSNADQIAAASYRLPVEDQDFLLRPEMRGARFMMEDGLLNAPTPDAAFARMFFGIWLADSTREPELRKALLARAAP